MIINIGGKQKQSRNSHRIISVDQQQQLRLECLLQGEKKKGMVSERGYTAHVFFSFLSCS